MKFIKIQTVCGKAGFLEMFCFQLITIYVYIDYITLKTTSDMNFYVLDTFTYSASVVLTRYTRSWVN